MISMLPLSARGIDCIPTSIDAFKDQYSDKSGKITVQTLMDHICKNSSTATSAGVAIPPFAGTWNQAEVQKACEDKNTSFFETYWREIGMSNLTKDGLAAWKVSCGQGLILDSRDVSKDHVTITARFDVESPIPGVITISPSNALACGIDLTKVKIGGAESVWICDRKSTSEIAVKLHTDFGGDRSLMIPAYAPTEKAIRWTYVVGRDTGYIGCTVNGQTIGAWHDCAAWGTCGNGALGENRCAAEYKKFISTDEHGDPVVPPALSIR
jgi:hypothetical protein